MAENGNIQLKKGDILFVQGETPRELYMLAEGALEILSASDEFEGMDNDIIVSKSSRVGTVQGKSLLAGYSNLFLEPYRKSMRALTDSVVVKYPLRKGGFKGIAVGDPGQAASILKQLFNRIQGAVNDADKIRKLYTNICRVGDNMAIMFKEISFSEVDPKMMGRAENLHDRFTENDGVFPDSFTAKFLVTDNGPVLKKSYDLPDEAQNDIRMDIFNFIKRLLMLDPKVLSAMLKADPKIAVSMFSILFEKYQGLLDGITGIYDHLEGELSLLFGEAPSWAEYLASDGGFSEWLNTGKIDEDFIKDILTLAKKINASYEDVFGRKITQDYGGIKKIHEFYTSGMKSGASDVPVPSPAEESAEVSGDGGEKIGVPAAIGGEMKNSLSQIFEYAVYDKESQKTFLKLLNEFKSMKNPLSTESDGRKLRRQITKLYWDLYKQAFMRSKAEKIMPKPVWLMIKYGYIDEELVDEEQISELLTLATKKESYKEIPVLFEHEFLDLIYQSEEEPSITEMGLDYRGYLREQEKHASRKKNEEAPAVAENVQKTMYEIEQRLRSTSAVCSGSTSTAFPILTSHVARGNLTGIYTSKEKVESIIQEVRDIDFSVFYRETVLKLGEAREIIMEEVYPYIILLPIFGTRTLLWQEIVGTNKRSRGRIVVPIFFMGDLMKNLIHTLASFRWELNRTIKGQAMWADPIEGGITGEYFDYVNTYKKNPNLSGEAKEKIKERFKSLRTNRDRFADDYSMWLMYEKDGIMKLNSVVREMMYKHIPFSKDYREKLGNMPAFQKSANRYKNISARELANYQRRFKKYQNEDGSHPEEIEKFFKYLEL